MLSCCHSHERQQKLPPRPNPKTTRTAARATVGVGLCHDAVGVQNTRQHAAPVRAVKAIARENFLHEGRPTQAGAWGIRTRTLPLGRRPPFGSQSVAAVWGRRGGPSRFFLTFRAIVEV